MNVRSPVNEAQLVDEGESLNISDMTYLFTDLKKSTPLYESVGDVNAYFWFASTSRS